MCFSTRNNMLRRVGFRLVKNVKTRIIFTEYAELFLCYISGT